MVIVWIVVPENFELLVGRTKIQLFATNAHRVGSTKIWAKPLVPLATQDFLLTCQDTFNVKNVLEIHMHRW